MVSFETSSSVYRLCGFLYAITDLIRQIPCNFWESTLCVFSWDKAEFEIQAKIRGITGHNHSIPGEYRSFTDDVAIFDEH